MQVVERPWNISPDIREYLDFTFYDWVTYHEKYGLGELLLGQWIGVSHKVGQDMSYCILPVSGILISCTMVQILTQEEKATEEWKVRIEDYDTNIAERINVKDSDLSKQVLTEYRIVYRTRVLYD